MGAMTGERIPAEAFPVGDFIREEIAERGWTPGELARRSGLDEDRLSDLITGACRIGARDSERLAAAFGTSPELWAQLDMAYRRHRR